MKNSHRSPVSQNHSARKVSKPASSKVHPVVVYPFTPPTDFSDLEELYGLVAGCNTDPRFGRPITVVDRKTAHAAQWSKRFTEFRSKVVEKVSDVFDCWCVDTCQMWYTGLGAASERGQEGDVYWLIPGDFNYGSPVGKEVLQHLNQLPDTVLNQTADLCLGEIAVDINSSKQLIDTYGTLALLQNWFPDEASDIRAVARRPRSEFFALNHALLQEALTQRWYPYEQTLVLVLRAMSSKRRMGTVTLGDISDIPPGRESLASAVQQVERMERVLKMEWRERHQSQHDWMNDYHVLDAQSAHIHSAALAILHHALG